MALVGLSPRTTLLASVWLSAPFPHARSTVRLGGGKTSAAGGRPLRQRIVTAEAALAVPFDFPGPVSFRTSARHRPTQALESVRVKACPMRSCHAWMAPAAGIGGAEKPLLSMSALRVPPGEDSHIGDRLQTKLMRRPSAYALSPTATQSRYAEATARNRISRENGAQATESAGDGGTGRGCPIVTLI